MILESLELWWLERKLGICHKHKIALDIYGNKACSLCHEEQERQERAIELRNNERWNALWNKIQEKKKIQKHLLL